ncbi:hypothetical protein SAMN05443094_105243 [Domibacillus enclensis]|uniref:Uncharacterized protein n=1 Tax=Domibacillus enclensis TaxID=1017273 RepID=A0A1N6YDU9_9BACI|nr:hypothetical protein SAMN05443094_105243 [Domibacillus enclensis]
MYNDWWLLQFIFLFFVTFFIIVPLISIWFTRKKKQDQ